MPRITGVTIAEHREHTTRALLDAVERLIVERESASISMSAIASAAGVSRTAIYNYFPDKSALVRAAYTRLTESVGSGIGAISSDASASAVSRLRAMVDLVLVTFSRSPRQVLLAREIGLFLSDDDRAVAMAPLREYIRRELADVLQLGRRDGTLRFGDDVDLIVELIMGAVEAAVRRCVNAPENAVEIARTTNDFLSGTIGVRPTLRPGGSADERA